MSTLTTITATFPGIKSRPIETMSVVTYTGTGIISAAIILKLVRAKATTALADSRNSSGDNT